MTEGPERLREWLAAQGISQAELARRLGVTPGAVGHWCSGRSHPSLALAVTLADITSGSVPVRSWH